MFDLTAAAGGSTRLQAVVAALLLGALPWFPLTAQAQETPGDAGPIPIPIDVQYQRAPLAVPDAQLLGGVDAANLGAHMTRVLRRDLELSSHFDLILPGHLFFDPRTEGFSAETIDFDNWRSVDAGLLLKTAYQIAGNQLRAEFWLFDVEAGAPIELGVAMAGTLPATVEAVEARAHEIANQLVAFRSGHPGPFGSRLALVAADADGNREIAALTLGGDALEWVTRDRDINILPKWAGGAIVYTTYADGNPDLAMTSGSERRVLSNRPGINTGAALSPDGREMAVVLSHEGNTEIYLIDPEDGAILRRLTHNRTEDVSPSWSPDGSELAFVSDRSGQPQIYVMSRDGSDQRRITFAGSYSTTPEWSPLPGDRRIAFTGRGADHHLNIFIVDADSGAIEPLTYAEGDNESPTWSPDGQYLAFASNRGDGASRIYLVALHNGAQHLLTREGGGFSMPSWRH
jgi:TolB protein